MAIKGQAGSPPPLGWKTDGLSMSDINSDRLGAYLSSKFDDDYRVDSIRGHYLIHTKRGLGPTEFCQIKNLSKPVSPEPRLEISVKEFEQICCTFFENKVKDTMQKSEMAKRDSPVQQHEIEYLNADPSINLRLQKTRAAQASRDTASDENLKEATKASKAPELTPSTPPPPYSPPSYPPPAYSTYHTENHLKEA
ncbi:hypothetical protein GGR51DRAFT_25612 [Nemania sp. FL0031]|nr:hypothetical protein GGR51DRAFT_25612 [Nemania sp. FL0031]